MDDITGQLILWNKGPGPIKGKNVVQVFGLIGLPKELAETFCADDNIQRHIMGRHVPDLGLSLTVSETHFNKLKSARGGTPDTLLTSRIWRM